ncbi:MAG: hypothetical protein V1765_01375 [bacterium]
MNENLLNNEGQILFDNSSKPKDVVDQVLAEQPQPSPTTINISLNKLMAIKHLADNVQASAKQLSELLSTYVADQEIKPAKPVTEQTAVQTAPIQYSTPAKPEETGRIIEGLFNGEKMIGPDGQLYDVPVNYASKSKLVEGDMLKLIITERGTFVYKQIQPVDRVRIVGILEQGPTGESYATVNDRRWRILGASVSYFHGQPGDEVIMLIPQEGSSRWAAVENIIKKS